MTHLMLSLGHTGEGIGSLMSAAILPLWLNVKPIWEIEKHMKVYRFEDPVTHVGVYQGRYAPARSYYEIDDIKDDASDRRRHPTPNYDFSEDILDHVSPREVKFGFANVAQAKHWFNNREGRRAMAAEGAAVDVYEVPEKDVFLGGHQVIYRPGSAHLIDTLNAETLEK